MPKALFQKLALYSILPCLLVFLAMFLNGLFQPRLQWNVKLLENKEGLERIENLGESTTALFQLPVMGGYSKEGYPCAGAVDWVYVQNKLLQDKSILEGWVNINNSFALGVTFLAILLAIANAMYLLKLKQKAGWGGIFAITFLVAISVIVLITVLGPIKTGDIFCLVPIKAEAELTKISLDGMSYAFLGAIVNILAIIVLVKRYLQKTGFDQVDDGSEKPLQG
ncbi:MAG: hypothetical protein WA821_03165 [Anaerolineales bacterium]